MASTSYSRSRPQDPNQLAKTIVGLLTSAQSSAPPAPNDASAASAGRAIRTGKLGRRRRVQILRLLLEGRSLRTVAHMSNVSYGFVAKLFVDTATAADELQDQAFRKGELTCNQLQLVRLWSFGPSGPSRFTKRTDGADDIWTWAAIDPETRLLASWRIGGRASDTAAALANDVARRLTRPVRIRIENQDVYVAVAEGESEGGINRAVLAEIYGPASRDERYVGGASSGRERLAMRVDSSPWGRSAPAFAKKVEGYARAVALHGLYYNFCRVDKTLHVTPARKAAIAGPRVWEIDDIVQVLENWEVTK
jgi:hypothetical protein